MLNRRFMSYIVGGCVAGLLFVCFMGYREYQKHVAFERLISGAEAFNRSIEPTDKDGHIYLTEAPTHAVENPDLSAAMDTTNPYFKGKEGDEYVYFIGKGHIYSPVPLDPEDIEMDAWEVTGVKTPYVEQRLKDLAENSPYKGQVVQRIVTPDGQLHKVIVPREMQYKEGDAILRSELDPPILEALEQDQHPARIEIAGEPIPDEYYSIEDSYERHEFIKKVMLTKQLKISLAEVEAKIARGELDVSLSDMAKRSVEEKMEIDARKRMLLSFAQPALSDKPPVKVKFLSDTGEDALPGWMQKLERNAQHGSGNAIDSERYSAADFINGQESHDDIRGAPIRSDVPRAPSDLSNVVESTPSPPNIADLEKRLTPEGVEAKLEGLVSPDRFDKAQQLIDQYGTEEGLRRLRESDPEAAQQFEQEPLRSDPAKRGPRSDRRNLRSSEPSPDAPDSEESEQ